MDSLLQVWKESSWTAIRTTLVLALAMNSTVQWLVLRFIKKNHPPFYMEFPYIPWLGSLVQFATQPREFLERAAAQCGNVFTIRLFGKHMTFLMGTEGHAFFFRAKEDVFDIREAYAMTVTTFGPGVCYDVPQSRMGEHFSFFKSGLSDAAFVKYMDMVQDEVERFFTHEWGDEGEADLLESLSDVFTLTSSRCLLGEEIRKRWKDSGVAEHYLALDASFIPILFFAPSIPNPNRTKCIKARQLFEKIFCEIMDERRAKAKNDPKNYTPPRDFLQDLMEATYKDCTKPTTTEITGILIGVLLGGQHTSNVTSTWIVTYLLKNKEWYDKVMDEQRTLFEKKRQPLLSPSTLTYDEVQSMPVFEQVFMEILRLHHPFFQLSRSVKQDTVFNGTVIPKGHYVNVAPSAAMRMSEIFPNGDKFDPSRFAPERKDEIKPYSFIGFGAGLHQCGGRKFAWNSLKASLSWLLRNYDIEFIGKGAVEMEAMQAVGYGEKPWASPWLQ